MKRLLLATCLLLVAGLAQAKPRYSFPTNPDEVGQNDRDLDQQLRKRTDPLLTNTSGQMLVGQGNNVAPIWVSIGSRVFQRTNTDISFINIATGSWVVIDSILLSPGDWDISAFVTSGLNAGAITRVQFGINTSSGNDSTGMANGDSYGELPPALAAYNVSCGLPGWQVTPAISTTYYLKVFISASATPQAIAGRLSARRIKL